MRKPSSPTALGGPSPGNVSARFREVPVQGTYGLVPGGSGWFRDASGWSWVVLGGFVVLGAVVPGMKP